MNWKWIDEIEGGAFHVEMCPLRLFNEKCTYQGQGTLTWSEESGIELEAFTDGGDRAFIDMLASGEECKYGELIPDSVYLQCEGISRDDWRITIDRIPPGYSSSHSGHPTAIWHIPDSGIYSDVRIESEPDDRITNQTLALFGPVDIKTWPRSSETEYKNPQFGMRTRGLDWLQVETSRATISCQRRDNERSRVGFVHKHSDFNRTITAFRAALAFITGRSVNVIAADSFTPNKRCRRLKWDKKPVRSKAFSSPIGSGHSIANPELILCIATDFFALEENQYAMNILHACIDSADNTFTTKSMVLGAAAEGLIRRLCSDRRLKVSNKLRDWASRSVLGMVNDDEVAWRELRNLSAHGDLLLTNRRDTAKRVAQMGRLHNLLLKLFLQLIKYEGKYFNNLTGATEEFPLAATTDL